jgi:hypothetical protein
MKAAASILTILMLFFTAQPVLVQCQPVMRDPKPVSNCCGKTCNKKQEKKPDTRDCNRTDACNPFAGCSQCHYIAASKFFYNSGLSIAGQRNSYAPGENILAGFQPDCWQPPELTPCSNS